MALTEEQTQEVLKLQRLDKQYEGLIRTSRNAEQQKRAKIELKKIRDRIDELCPDGVPADLNAVAAPVVSEADRLNSYTVLSKFSIQKASPNSDNNDVNLMYTVLQVWENEFIPGTGDGHLKLDFSLSSERDSHYAILENQKRYLKQLVDTVEDYAAATRDDFKLQLRDMKDRYTRHYLGEGATFLKRIREFWKKIHEDIQQGGHACMNKNDVVKFDRRFEGATFLEGYPVPKLVETAYIFVKEAIDALNLPDIPDTK